MTLPAADLAGGPGRHILVAEDDPGHRWVIQRLFREIGHGGGARRCALDFVSNGEEAVLYLAEARDGRKPWPDLLLMDLHMPVLGGVETVQRLREDPATRALPVVVLSGSAHPQHVAQAYGAGCNAYMVKLGDYRMLTAQLRHFLAFWLDVAQLPAPAMAPAAIQATLRPS